MKNEACTLLVPFGTVNNKLVTGVFHYGTALPMGRCEEDYGKQKSAISATGIFVVEDCVSEK